MTPLLLLGMPNTFAYPWPLRSSVLNSGPHSNSLALARQTPEHLFSSLSTLLLELHQHALMQKMQGHLSHVLGMSTIQDLDVFLKESPQESGQGMCLLLASFKPQDSLSDWRQALAKYDLAYQVIHGSLENLGERLLHALGAHAQQCGVTSNVLRAPPKERPRIKPCECCVSSDCERRLFDFLTLPQHLSA